MIPPENHIPRQPERAIIMKQSILTFLWKQCTALLLQIVQTEKEAKKKSRNDPDKNNFFLQVFTQCQPSGLGRVVFTLQ